MTANAFTLHLPDFARRPDQPPPTVEMEPIEAPKPVEDPLKALAEAHEIGVREGRAVALVEFERARAADLARYDARLVEERRRWTEEESDRLAAQIAAAMQDIEAGIAASVARILVPFVAESVRRSALDELSDTLTTLLTAGGMRALVVRGPDDLVEPLKAKLGAYAAAIEFQTATGPDILATAGETIVETRLGAWLARLAAAVE